MKTNKTSQWLLVISRMKRNSLALKILHSLVPISFLTKFLPSPAFSSPSPPSPPTLGTLVTQNGLGFPKNISYFDISVYFLMLFFPLGIDFLLFELFKSNLKPTSRSTSNSTSAVRENPIPPGVNSSNSSVSRLKLSSLLPCSCYLCQCLFYTN